MTTKISSNKIPNPPIIAAIVFLSKPLFSSFSPNTIVGFSGAGIGVGVGSGTRSTGFSGSCTGSCGATGLTGVVCSCAFTTTTNCVFIPS